MRWMKKGCHCEEGTDEAIQMCDVERAFCILIWFFLCRGAVSAPDKS